MLIHILNYRRGGDLNNEGHGGCGIFVFFGIVLVLAGMVVTYNHYTGRAWVDENEAHERMRELAGTDDVTIIRHTNTNYWLGGDPQDVTYELEVASRPQSGRCTESYFGPLVCRLYGAGGE